MNTQQFEKSGFVSVPYPQDLRQAVMKAVQSWRAFCMLPDETKKNLPYSNGDAGIGYELKLGEGIKGDRKENFDATVAGVDWLKQNAEAIRNEVAINFITDSTNLVKVLAPSVISFAEKLESEFGLVGIADEVRGGEGSFFVRFIHYFGQRNVGDETAAAHVDQSGFTFHLYESDEGLQCLTLSKPHQWINMPVDEGQTVVIPSMQLQLRSEGKLTALCHRVVATKQTAYTGRYSAVCFIQLKDTPKYNKNRHGRLQEKEPGFNYSMPFDEFANFFN